MKHCRGPRCAPTLERIVLVPRGKRAAVRRVPCSRCGCSCGPCDAIVTASGWRAPSPRVQVPLFGGV